MITIPIWVFVIFVIATSILTIVIDIVIISYIRYCASKNKAIRKEIEEKYGTQKNK